jgi:hypothetical protein
LERRGRDAHYNLAIAYARNKDFPKAEDEAGEAAKAKKDTSSLLQYIRKLRGW